MSNPGPYDPYSTVPLGGSALAKFKEQEAQRTRLTDPTGVGGNAVPDYVYLMYEGARYRLHRKAAVQYDLEGKVVDLQGNNGVIEGRIVDKSILSDPNLERVKKEKMKSTEAEKALRNFKRWIQRQDQNTDGVVLQSSDIIDELNRRLRKLNEWRCRHDTAGEIWP